MIRLHNMYTLKDSLTQKFQTLNIEQKQAVVDIAERIVDLEMALASLQIMANKSLTLMKNR